MGHKHPPRSGFERLAAQHPGVIAVGPGEPRRAPAMADCDALPDEGHDSAAAHLSPAQGARWGLGGWLMRRIWRGA